MSKAKKPKPATLTQEQVDRARELHYFTKDFHESTEPIYGEEILHDLNAGTVERPGPPARGSATHGDVIDALKDAKVWLPIPDGSRKCIVYQIPDEPERRRFVRDVTKLVNRARKEAEEMETVRVLSSADSAEELEEIISACNAAAVALFKYALMAQRMSTTLLNQTCERVRAGMMATTALEAKGWADDARRKRDEAPTKRGVRADAAEARFYVGFDNITKYYRLKRSVIQPAVKALRDLAFGEKASDDETPYQRMKAAVKKNR